MESEPEPVDPDDDSDSRETALVAAQAMVSKKAENILVLEVKDLILITHYFVICSGGNRRQVQAISDEVRHRIKRRGGTVSGIEGYRQGGWVLMDCQDVIVHVFLREMREYYDLELHWGDAKRIPFEEEEPAAAPIDTP